MRPGETLAILSSFLTLAGTYIFALFGTTDSVASGLGFISNLGSILSNAQSTVSTLNANLIAYYLLVIYLVISLFSGFILLIGIKSRFLMFFLCWLPISLGTIILILISSDLLANATTLYTLFLETDQIGDVFPFLVPVGDVGLGTYLLLAGGALGFISIFIPRRKKR